MKILWINPSFLDYRVPVYEELNKLTGGNLSIVFSTSDGRTPERVAKKIKKSLGENAIALKNEKFFRIGKNSNFANRFLNIPWQPGLYKIVMDSAADIIIVEGYFQWSPLAFIRKLFKGSPVILSYERTFHTERKSGYLRTLYRKIISKFFIDAAIVNGLLSKEYVHFLGVSNRRIFSGCMAADSNFFRKASADNDKRTSRLEYSFPENIPIFLYVGQIIDRKGILELVREWENYDSSACLVIVGEGDKLDDLHQICREKEFRNVFVLGHVEYGSLPKLYSASDVFIIPTLEDNWSLVVPEAMASGLPVACSIYNGCWPELVIDGVTGKLFDPLVPDSIHECLDFFIGNEVDINTMGKAAQDVESQYSPDAVAEKIYAACCSVFNESDN